MHTNLRSVYIFKESSTVKDPEDHTLQQLPLNTAMSCSAGGLNAVTS